MKRIILSILLLPALMAVQARPTNALTQEDYFYAYFDDALACFDETNDGVEKACQYAIADIDGNGKKELVLADINKLKCVFNVVDGQLVLVSPEYVINDNDLNWNSVNNFLVNVDVDRSQDVTLRHRPVFAYDINIAANRFTVPGDVAYSEQEMRSTVYDRMVFKPHVGNIHFVKAAPGSYDSDGNTIDLGMCYTYALDDASRTKTMFRGYSDHQAVPIIVPRAWLDDHNPLQFSRWLDGEPVRKGTADVHRIIQQYYGPQVTIRESRWLAGCELNERSFYSVIFEPFDGHVLLAFVCIAEGEVVSTRNMWFDHDPAYPEATQEGPDIDDLMWFSPSIMAMVATPAGLELYVSWGSLEGVHYDIWREVADQFLTIQEGYHYTMAY